MRYLIFSDLDGTLLDHHTYATKVAKMALANLKARDIPVIFCSSKTFEEQLFLQKKLHLEYPCIIENGSAVIVPKNYFVHPLANATPVSSTHSMIALAKKDIKDVHLVLEEINKSKTDRLRGFTSASLQEIAAATGLSGAAARRAKNRWFSNTLMSKKPTQAAISTLESKGFCLSQGGRFLTVQDQTVDKGEAVKHLIHLYTTLWKTKPFTIGIGDSPNDAAMLRAVDKPFLVQKPDNTWMDFELDGLTKLSHAGPEGFLKMTTLL